MEFYFNSTKKVKFYFGFHAIKFFKIISIIFFTKKLWLKQQDKIIYCTYVKTCAKKNVFYYRNKIYGRAFPYICVAAGVPITNDVSPLHTLKCWPLATPIGQLCRGMTNRKSWISCVHCVHTQDVKRTNDFAKFWKIDSLKLLCKKYTVQMVYLIIIL